MAISEKSQQVAHPFPHVLEAWKDGHGRIDEAGDWHWMTWEGGDVDYDWTRTADGKWLVAELPILRSE